MTEHYCDFETRVSSFAAQRKLMLDNLQVCVFLFLPHSCSVERFGVNWLKAELGWQIAAESGRKLTSHFPRNQRGQRQHHQRQWHHYPHQEFALTLTGTRRLFVRKQRYNKCKSHEASQSISAELRLDVWKVPVWAYSGFSVGGHGCLQILWQ